MWENINVFKWLFMATYIAILLLVALYGMHRYILVYLYIKHRNNVYKPKAKFDQLPRVTIQLPMFNENMVAERIIRATCAIDYPADRLEIQVLDDSTDESADIARLECERQAAKGVPIRYMHRNNREGFKAGALQEGMKTATGDFIAIFDADFVPPADMLLNVVDFFTDEKVGMVQMRWDHLNRDASLLTKSQAIFLDGHFVIEHTARNRSGRFMHFNGTAGVWRRETITDAGGWQHDTLTEDLDLSYRAQLKGWQFVYCPQYAAPAELPPEMIAFKQQAHRWTKGSAQTGLKLLPGILRSNLPRTIKSEAFFHLTNTVVYPLMVLLTMLMYPAFIYSDGPWKNIAWGKVLFSVSLFVAATCSASTFFVYAQSELFGRGAIWRCILHLPVLMALGVGVCVNNTKAFIEAIWSHFKKKQSEFVRTPKYGVTGKHGKSFKPTNVFTFKRLTIPIIEICFGIYMLCFIFISVKYNYAIISLPFLMIFAGGYLYVGFSSLQVLWQMHQQQRAAILAAEVADPEVA